MIEDIVDCPFSMLRDAMIIFEGLWWESWRAASFPRPAFPARYGLFWCSRNKW